MTNTLAYHREYGLMGEDAGIGNAGADEQTRSYRWTNNVLAGAATQPYPDVTWRPTVQQHQAQFNPDYTLVATSTYRRAATDGTDLGVDWALLQQGLKQPQECASDEQRVEGGYRSEPGRARQAPLEHELVAAKADATGHRSRNLLSFRNASAL